MNYKPILIVAGEPNSIFTEIFIKSLRKIKIKSPIILICSFEILKNQMKKLKLRQKIKILDPNTIRNYNLNNNSINLINIDYNQKKAFKNSSKSYRYIKKCFDVAFKIINRENILKFINGPISKKHFLKKKISRNHRIYFKSFLNKPYMHVYI